MSSGTEAIDRKQRIRDRYRGVDTSELEVIPAKIVEGLGESTSIRRVAAYVRVSTDNDEQTSSYELQKNYYTDYIKAQPGWEFVGIYDDEGISGTSLAHRKGMQQLIEDGGTGSFNNSHYSDHIHFYETNICIAGWNIVVAMYTYMVCGLHTNTCKKIGILYL